MEDEPAIREVLLEVLEEHSLIAAGVSDGLEALYWLSRHEAPCAIILDLLMPRMSGIAVLEHLNEFQPSLIPTVVVASASPDMLRHAEAFPVAGRLSKPFELDALLSLVEQLCARGA